MACLEREDSLECSAQGLSDLAQGKGLPTGVDLLRFGQSLDSTDTLGFWIMFEVLASSVVTTCFKVASGFGSTDGYMGWLISLISYLADIQVRGTHGSG
ncbi:uncharacterized protein G2W53_028440 [Senna tora]|uniref:Uncharacterized protein n=1 Tax=Senna tora TaxID=362788 RepID=A0A834T5E9_9FABA|nr:uncharacterized protein G2W53_028440 [Senna tora]